jgi:hypothetical protein
MRSVAFNRSPVADTGHHLTFGYHLPLLQMHHEFRTAARAGMLGKHQQTDAGSITGSSKSKPGREWNAPSKLGLHASQVKHNGAEASALQ